MSQSKKIESFIKINSEKMINIYEPFEVIKNHLNKTTIVQTKTDISFKLSHKQPKTKSHDCCNIL